MDDLRVQISAEINQNKTINDINQSIRAMQKSGQLKDLNLNVDIDQGFQKAIKEFTKTADKLNKIIQEQNKVVKEEIMTIEKADGSIEKLTKRHLANGDVIRRTTQKIKESTKAKKDESNAVEALVTDLDELAKARTKAESSRFDKNGNLVKNTVKTGDDYNTLTTSTDRFGNETTQIDRNSEKLYQEKLKQAEKIAEIEKKRIKDVDAAEYSAYLEKQKREENIHGKRIQDQKVAYQMAKSEDDAYNAKRLKNEEEFSRKQQDTLNRIAEARKKYGHHTQVTNDLDSLERNVKNTELLNTKTKDWGNQLNNINTKIKTSTAGFKAMRIESVGMIESLKVGLAKVPVWALATTASDKLPL